MTDNSGNACPSDATIADRLRELAEDIAAFVALQNSRLQRVVRASVGGEESAGDLDLRRSELESRERELQRRECEALTHVEAECEKLTAAWDRLEAEQRRLLVGGKVAGARQSEAKEVPEFGAAPSYAGHRSVAGASALPAGDVDLIDDAGARPAGRGLARTEFAAAPPEAHSAPQDVEPWSREPAAQQFQQVKREIQRHARRRGS